MTATTPHIFQSYRRLYRHALHAVKYAVPARYVVRDELRRAYRSGSAADFNREKMDETIAFLQSATEENNCAHKILKSLIESWWWQGHGARKKR